MKKKFPYFPLIAYVESVNLRCKFTMKMFLMNTCLKLKANKNQIMIEKTCFTYFC